MIVIIYVFVSFASCRCFSLFFCCFKQKTAYEMRISDWSSDVCSSDLVSVAWAGKPMLINIWASWCGPCIEEMPELQRFHAEQGAHGVQVVGIALDAVEAVRDFLQRVPVDYPILFDAAGPADAGVRLGNPTGVLPYPVLEIRRTSCGERGWPDGSIAVVGV